MAWLTLRGDASGENKENEGTPFNALAVACSRADDPTKHELRVYAAATQPLDEQCEIVKPHSLGTVTPVALDASFFRTLRGPAAQVDKMGDV